MDYFAIVAGNLSTCMSSWYMSFSLISSEIYIAFQTHTQSLIMGITLMLSQGYV